MLIFLVYGFLPPPIFSPLLQPSGTVCTERIQRHDRMPGYKLTLVSEGQDTHNFLFTLETTVRSRRPLFSITKPTRRPTASACR